MEDVENVEVVVVVVDTVTLGPKICSLIATPPQYSYVCGGELPGQS
jgi:hypothetical protein